MEADLISILSFLIIGIAAGFFTGLFYSRSKDKTKSADQKELLDLREQYQNLDKEKSILSDRLQNAEKVFSEQKAELEKKEQINLKMNSEISKWQEQNKFLKEKLDSQKEEMEKLQQKFTTEFENLASKILKQNTRDFTETNEKRMTEILDPLKDKISTFEKKVSDVYDKEAKDRHSLKGEIKQLYELNKKINEEAHNLTKALKGDTKTQGNWGEFILEKILESSGLIKGKEYETQYSTTNPEGKRIQPDVVVYLPDDKHIIIDSKVSLTAYEEFVNEEDEAKRDRLLKNHLISVQSHIKKLSEKNYQQGAGMDSPDFVLLFLPIESSFSLAIQADRNLYSFAWDRKVVMVSPSTLLATLKTISSVWKHERQTKNALDIAEKAGSLYNKFVGFVEDMQKIERGLDSSRNAYNDAMNKLKEGRGNLVRQTERIRKLGAKTNKKLPKDLTEGAEDENQLEEEE